MEYELASKICVNSKWIASFLAKENQEYCECGMCKVIIKYIPNGHKYIVSKSEYEKLLDQEVKPDVEIKNGDKVLVTKTFYSFYGDYICFDESVEKHLVRCEGDIYEVNNIAKA